MPAQLPILDDRRWDDLVREGRALYAQGAPRVTDHNLHDPGMTLLELFAWLAETSIYRLDQVPEAHLQKFLKLLGYAQLDAIGSAGILSFDWPATASDFDLQEGAQFDVGHEGITLPMRTLNGLTLNGVQLDQLLLGSDSILDVTRRLEEGFPLSPFGTGPDAADTVYFGLSGMPASTTLSIGIKLDDPNTGIMKRRAIREELLRQGECCARILPDIDCGIGVMDEPLVPTLRHHSVRLQWEVFTSRDGGRWTPLEIVDIYDAPLTQGQVRDGTREFTLDGVVEVRPFSDAASTMLGGGAEPLFYLRARIIDGKYEIDPTLAAVQLNSVWAEQALPARQSIDIRPGASISGTVPTFPTTTRLQLSMNASGAISSIQFGSTFPSDPEFRVLRFQPPLGPAPGELEMEASLPGSGNGSPGQTFVIDDGQLVRDTLVVNSLSASGGWQIWNTKEDLLGAARGDYIVASDGSELTFGDGEHGRVLPLDARLFVRSARTLGAVGNIRQHSGVHLSDEQPGTSVDPAVVELIDNHVSALNGFFGGRDKESVREATSRLLSDFYAGEQLNDLVELDEPSIDQVNRIDVLAIKPPNRASTLAEIERVALATPGTRVARARAWPNRHPRIPCMCAPGVVTVVIVPDSMAARPQPSRGLKDAVHAFLECRRVVTTRIVVTGPSYAEVSVHVRVSSAHFTDADRLRERINEALNRFLDPIRGGELGRGWPFGRDVYKTEIAQQILCVDGVEKILELSLRADDEPVPCDNVPLCETALTAPGHHEIEVDRR